MSTSPILKYKAIYKPWDSDFFGKAIYNLNVSDNTISQQNLNELVKAHPGALLQVQVSINDLETINELLQTRFYWVDNTIGFIKTKLECCPDYPYFMRAQSQDIEQIRCFLPGLFSESRYRGNRFYKVGDADRLYFTWVLKALHGEFDDELFVWKESSDVIGFVSIKYIEHNKSQIGLIGIRQDWSSRGIGTKMMTAMENYCYNQGITSLIIKTQLSNSKAISLNSKLGYKVTEVTSWFYYSDLGLSEDTSLLGAK